MIDLLDGKDFEEGMAEQAALSLRKKGPADRESPNLISEPPITSKPLKFSMPQANNKH